MKKNTTFLTLSFFGIIMVVSAHCLSPLNLFNDFFPYNSFFMPMFMFISGYFFKDDNVKDVKSIWIYIRKKIITLLLYYFIWNIIYALFMIFLYKIGLMQYQIEFNLKTIFIYPFIHGQQSHVNAPAWFIPTLFMVEMCFLIIRKLQLKFDKILPWLSLCLLLIVSVLSVFIAQRYLYIGSIVILFTKVGFFLFFFQLGKIYHDKIENHEQNIKSIIVFAIVISINLICIFKFKDIAFASLYDMSGFRDLLPFLPIITSITGIWFWLRISKIIAPVITNNKLFLTIANNTKTIMMHHMLFMTLLNIIFYKLKDMLVFKDFDVSAFKNLPVWYHYLGSSPFVVSCLYLFVGIFGPLLILKLEKFVINLVHKTFKHIKKPN